MSKEPKRDEEHSRQAAPPKHDPMEAHPNNPAQLNRDNVNPNIPPAEPKTLREARAQEPVVMQEPPGARIIPPKDGPTGETPPAREGEHATHTTDDPSGFPDSINEPPGSQVLPPVEQPPPEQPPPEEEIDEQREPLPPKDQLEEMTRAELDELAEQRGVHVTSSMNKGEVIDELRKDARRKR